MRIGLIKGDGISLAAYNILKHAYAKIGISVKAVELPAARSLEEANTGDIDGDAARIAQIANKYSNLIPVKPPIIVIRGAAFAKAGFAGSIKEWQDLKPWRVGIVRGMKVVEHGTSGMPVTAVNNPKQLVRMLDHGRLDLMVIARTNGALLVRSIAPDSGIHATGNDLFTVPMFHFLNKSHAGLIKKIEPVLWDMNQKGTNEALFKKTMEPAAN